MRYLEYKHQDSALGRLFDRVCNALTLPPEMILPLVYVFRRKNGTFEVKWFNEGRRFGIEEPLYWNGRWFVRIMLPFWVGIMWRFNEREHFQTSILPNVIGLIGVLLTTAWWGWFPIPFTSWWWVLFLLPGWKLIGRPAYHFRFQSDESEQGGLVDGFQDGPK